MLVGSPDTARKLPEAFLSYSPGVLHYELESDSQMYEDASGVINGCALAQMSEEVLVKHSACFACGTVSRA